MHIGHYISGAAHVGLIGWVLFGGAFRSDLPPVEVSEVAIITAEEFAALTPPGEAPDLSSEVVAPKPPEATEAPEVAEQPDEDVAQVAPEEIVETEPDTAPVVPDPQPPEPEDVMDDAPVLPEPEVDTAVVIPNTPVQPDPVPADRVAPEPVAQPKPDTTIADDVQEATQPDESGQAAEEVLEDTAPEAASSEIITEPKQEDVASAAPTSSLRPKLRPARPAVTEPEPTPTPTPTDDAVAAALAEAAESEPSPAPSGPPLTGGEKDALRLSVQQCWVVDVGSRAADVTVIVGLSLDRNGKVQGDVRLIDATGGDEAAVRTAFQAARRAVLRCQKSGYDLPQEKYDHWKDVEITFNPEKMRRK
ncbi:cell division and transport-associated protein TolA [Shimia isoporae]|uniref:Cell division and transport-associated protein TolA n=1 Tax=Shimia isoporae TaxID=647720 RepID=A0A4R1NLU0_9RHOB|nr:energy transducer TonB [Shimia isoporae]TCL08689.1 cell division and transport-associated protein TolA [Shimia isoporae]